MIFSRELLSRSAFSVVLGSGGGVVEGDFLKSRDLLIIFHKDSIFFPCLAWIVTISMITADITIFIINCWKDEAIT